jgi:cyanate permease
MENKRNLAFLLTFLSCMSFGGIVSWLFSVNDFRYWLLLLNYALSLGFCIAWVELSSRLKYRKRGGSK